MLAASPDVWGPRTMELRQALDKIEGPGKDSAKRAARLLDQANGWVDHGELAAAALPVLHDVLDPVAGDEEGDQG
jgi:hypothetical protein